MEFSTKGNHGVAFFLGSQTMWEVAYEIWHFTFRQKSFAQGAVSSRKVGRTPQNKWGVGRYIIVFRPYFPHCFGQSCTTLQSKPRRGCLIGRLPWPTPP